MITDDDDRVGKRQRARLPCGQEKDTDREREDDRGAQVRLLGDQQDRQPDHQARAEAAKSAPLGSDEQVGAVEDGRPSQLRGLELDQATQRWAPFTVVPTPGSNTAAGPAG